MLRLARPYLGRLRRRRAARRRHRVRRARPDGHRHLAADERRRPAAAGPRSPWRSSRSGRWPSAGACSATPNGSPGTTPCCRMITDVRARVFATLAARRGTAHRSGDALSRLVSDVEAVQDLLLRVLVPGSAAAAGRRAGGRRGGADLTAGRRRARRRAAGRRGGAARAGHRAHPARPPPRWPRCAARSPPTRSTSPTAPPTWPRSAATEAALRRRRGSAPDRLARLERRLAATGFAVDAAGVLVAGADRRRGGAGRARRRRVAGCWWASWPSARWPPSRWRWRWSRRPGSGPSCGPA